MDNDFAISFQGKKIPLTRVKHWRLHPEAFNPLENEESGMTWSALQQVMVAWNTLNSTCFANILSEEFRYSSFWVTAESLNKSRYLSYIKGKFEAIRASGKIPTAKLVVLYESLTPAEFPYALEITSGDITTLLTFEFSAGRISSMNMTEPKIFTYEHAFAKGGILDGNGEPRVFRHLCEADRKGMPMTVEEAHAFAVTCVETLFKEVNANVKGVHKSVCKELPNITTTCNKDSYFYRIDVVDDECIIEERLDAFREVAKMHSALPLIMPVLLWCVDSPGLPTCGGDFFLRVLEARDA